MGDRPPLRLGAGRLAERVADRGERLATIRSVARVPAPLDATERLLDGAQTPEPAIEASTPPAVPLARPAWMSEFAASWLFSDGELAAPAAVPSPAPAPAPAPTAPPERRTASRPAAIRRGAVEELPANALAREPALLEEGAGREEPPALEGADDAPEEPRRAPDERPAASAPTHGEPTAEEPPNTGSAWSAGSSPAGGEEAPELLRAVTAAVAGREAPPPDGAGPPPVDAPSRLVPRPADAHRATDAAVRPSLARAAALFDDEPEHGDEAPEATSELPPVAPRDVAPPRMRVGRLAAARVARVPATGAGAAGPDHDGPARPASVTSPEHRHLATSPTSPDLPPVGAAPDTPDLPPHAAAPDTPHLPLLARAPGASELPSLEAAPTSPDAPPVEAAPDTPDLPPREAALTSSDLPSLEAARTSSDLPPDPPDVPTLGAAPVTAETPSPRPRAGAPRTETAGPAPVPPPPPTLAPTASATALRPAALATALRPAQAVPADPVVGGAPTAATRPGTLARTAARDAARPTARESDEASTPGDGSVAPAGPDTDAGAVLLRPLALPTPDGAGSDTRPDPSHRPLLTPAAAPETPPPAQLDAAPRSPDPSGPRRLLRWLRRGAAPEPDPAPQPTAPALAPVRPAPVALRPQPARAPAVHAVAQADDPAPPEPPRAAVLAAATGATMAREPDGSASLTFAAPPAAPPGAIAAASTPAVALPSGPDHPPPAPGADVDALYEQVVERLRRDLLVERERMGDLLGQLP